MKIVSKRLNTEHVKAMTKAMEIVPTFIVEKTDNTVIVKTRKGVEVYRALKLSECDLWLVAHAKNLFNAEG